MVNGIGSNTNYMCCLQTGTPRSSPGPAEMFNKVDSDGSGGISQSELETFAEGMSSKTGGSIDTTDAVSTYDADGNGELSSDEFGSFMQANMPPPGGMGGPHGPGGMSGDEEDTSSSGYLDPLDTNGDGTVDAQEAAASGLNMLTQSYMRLIGSMFGTQEDNQSLVNFSA